MSTHQPSDAIAGQDDMRRLAAKRRRLIAELRDVERAIMEIVSRSGIGDEGISHLSILLGAVGRAFRVAPNDIVGRRRTQHISLARHAFCYVARNTGQMTYEGIGSYLMRDHGAVINGERRARSLIETEPAYARTIAEIERVVR